MPDGLLSQCIFRLCGSVCSMMFRADSDFILVFDCISSRMGFHLLPYIYSQVSALLITCAQHTYTHTHGVFHVRAPKAKNKRSSKPDEPFSCTFTIYAIFPILSPISNQAKHNGTITTHIEKNTYLIKNGFSVLENRSAKLCRATAVTSAEPK